METSDLSFPTLDAALSAPSPHLPRGHATESVRHGIENWIAEAQRLAEDAPALAAFMTGAAAESAPRRAVLEAVFGNSPFLTMALIREPAILQTLCERGADAAWDDVIAALDASLSGDLTEAVVMKALRVGKRRIALLTALADICHLWPMQRVTEALSDYAEIALSRAVSFLLRDGVASGNLELAHPEAPETGSGYVVLGMGKLGARELNYSSDIDIIVLFDPDIARYVGKKSPGDFFVRMTKALVRIMDERTGDGYVFRTDLRLRPDPGSTAVAITTEAAEIYYESFGQNWERAAMIKVRPVAGDRQRGAEFVQHLRPFVWRKSLDFYAIQDIHSIKRQINAVKACGVVQVAGHNIKLGRGGIREIEFFAQTQQLIWGGRLPETRCQRTLDALNALVDSGHVKPTVRDELTAAYIYLRTLEHRLQMIDDQQTQTLPKDPEKLAAMATFMGCPNVEAFNAEVRAVLCTVEAHYADLFEESPSLSDETGNLVFTGGEDDPGTLNSLAEMGFKNTSEVSGTVRGWHHGRYRAVRSTRSKELLTELVPTLLRAFGKTAQPDEAFFRFDAFLSRLPAGVQLFSMFHISPGLLDLLAEILGDAPRLSEILARQPNMLDAVLTPGFFDALPDRTELGAELDTLLSQSRDYEETIDLLRLWANGRRFQVGVQTLRHLTDAREGGEALTAIADVVLGRLMSATTTEFVQAHGTVEGGELVIVAMGKAGGREMTATSDLDLIMVYDATGDVSDGPRPISRNDYFIRLTQRIINGITAMTKEGRLYEVDMRLRPSGSKGPLAVSLTSFEKYNLEDAWTWEHLALTRARVVCGPQTMADKVHSAITRTMERPRDPDKLLVDVADMRALMARERKPSGLFDVKLMRGGLVDIEFLVQYMILRHAPEHPGIHRPNVAEALVALGDAGLLTADEVATLDEAHRLWLELQSVLRFSITGTFVAEDASQGLKEKLAKAAHEPDFQRLAVRMEQTYEAIYAVFRHHVETPAEAARERLNADKKLEQETPQ